MMNARAANATQLDYGEFAAMLAHKNEEDNMLEAFRIFGTCDGL